MTGTRGTTGTSGTTTASAQAGPTGLSQRSRLRAVLLDIDDTLVDTRYAFHRALAHVVETWLPHLDPEAARRAVRHWIGDPRGHFRRYIDGKLDFFTQRRLRVDDLHATFAGPTLDDDAWDRWQGGYEAAFQAAWRPTADAVALLDLLVAEGLILGSVTNGETGYQLGKLGAVGLSGRLATVVGVDVLGRGKPDPEVFRLACDRLGVSVAETAHIGDELDVDARGARDAGLVGIWLDRHGSGLTPPDVPVARGLADVPGLLGLGPHP